MRINKSAKLLPKVLSIFLLLSLALSLVSCRSTNFSEIVEFESLPTESIKKEPEVEETEQSETIKESKDDEEKAQSTESKAKESKESYDYSKEFRAGNLAGHSGGSVKSFLSSENGQEVAGLDKLVRGFLKDKGLENANVSIVYQDLQSGARYSYNGSQRYVAASTVKVAVGMVVAQLTDEGVFPPDMEILYVPGEHFAADNLDSSRLGKPVPIWDLVYSSIAYSDNAATSVIFEYFFRQGQYLHNFMDSRVGTHYSGDVTMSAEEGIGLIEQLYSDSRYPSYAKIRDYMSASTWGQFLTAGIPVNVSSKYGNLAALNHEIGLAWTNKPFAYSVYTDGIAAYDILPQLGELLYNYNQGLVQATEPATPNEESPHSQPNENLPPAGEQSNIATNGEIRETSPPPIADEGVRESSPPPLN